MARGSACSAAYRENFALPSLCPGPYVTTHAVAVSGWGLSKRERETLEVQHARLIVQHPVLFVVLELLEVQVLCCV